MLHPIRGFLQLDELVDAQPELAAMTPCRMNSANSPSSDCCGILVMPRGEWWMACVDLVLAVEKGEEATGGDWPYRKEARCPGNSGFGTLGECKQSH
jgi:hypothetical protein